MRKALLMLVVLLLGGGTLGFLSQPRVQMPFSVLLGSGTRHVAERSRLFMEDIQFKDFQSAAKYSSPADRKNFDVPRLIERLFQVKPEFLDIQRIEILSAEIDSTHTRARVKMLAHVKVLNTSELRKPEVLLYWKKSDAGVWEMDLASSLQ